MRGAPPRRAWIAAALLLSCAVGCARTPAAVSHVPSEAPLVLVVPSLGQLMDAIARLERRLPATAGLGEAVLRWGGIDPSDPAALKTLGLVAESDVVAALQDGVLVVAVGRARASKLLDALERRVAALGLRAAGRSGEDRLFEDRKGSVRASLRARGEQPVLLALRLGGGDDGGEGVSAALSVALDAWGQGHAPINAGATVSLLRQPAELSEAAPEALRALLAWVAAGTVGLELGEDHLELAASVELPALAPFLALLRPVTPADGKAGAPELADSLPLDTTAVIRADVAASVLLRLPAIIRKPILDPLRAVRLPGLDAPADLPALLLPHMKGPVALVAFGSRPGLRLQNLVRGGGAAAALSGLLRFGVVLEVTDAAALAEAWRPYGEDLKKRGFEISRREIEGAAVTELTWRGGLRAAVITEGDRVTVVQHRRDLQALLAVREGRRSVLSRRLTDSRARDTVAGRSCMLCGYAQFVRLSRDLESMGAPTFHLQLLGSVYHVLFRLGRDEKRYEAVLRADL